MNRLILLLFLLGITKLSAQVFSHSIKPSIVSSLNGIKNVSGANIDSLSENYIIEASKNKTKAGFIDITIKSTNDKSESFSISYLSLDLFKPNFEKYFKKIIASAEDATFSDSNVTFNDTEVSVLFARLITFERTVNERPVVANISLRKNIPIIITRKDTLIDEVKIKKIIGENKYDSSKHNPYIHEAKYKEVAKDVKVELTFYNGFVEKVEVEVDIFNLDNIRFTNLYSIGISSSNGIKKFVNHNISSFYKYKFNGTNKLVRNNEKDAFYLEINFADIISYDREIDVNANDISPEPTRLRLEESVLDQTKLYKEESTKLFEAVAYSDFIGLFDEENPNGLVQIEASKKFFINTDRKEIGKWYDIPPFSFYSEAVGIFEYLQVKTTLSKIEENNKFLQPILIGQESIFEPLSILQHQSFSIGGDLNLLYFENQNKKINTAIDFGLLYGQSGLQVSENEREFFNTLSSSLNLSFEFIPEKRYGFKASNRISYFEIFNTDNINVSSIKDGLSSNQNRFFNKTSFEFFVNVAPTTGKLFLRYQLLSELEDFDNNFSQLQFGYSFYILQQNGASN